MPLLETEWRKGTGFWKHLAGFKLANEYLGAARYTDALGIAKKLTDRDAVNPEYRHLLIQILYRLESDQDMLREIEELEAVGTMFLTELQIQELQLFRAVAAIRMGAGGWPRQVLNLFLDNRPSTVHYRMFLYIMGSEERKFNFSETELDFFKAFAQIADSSYAEAGPILERLLLEDPLKYLSSSTIYAAYKAHRSSGTSSRGAEFMDTLISRGTGGLSADEKYILFESAGLLRRSSGSLTASIPMFREALARAISEDRRERMQWYVFDTAAKVDVDGGLELLADMVAQWRNPDYFSDTLEEIITDLVAQRRWEDILNLYIDYGSRVDPYIEARLAYVCGAAVREGYLNIQQARRAFSGPDDPVKMSGLFFGRSMIEAGGHYYELISAAAIGTEPRFLNMVAPISAEKMAYTEQEELVAGYLRYGLLDEAYKLAKSSEIQDKLLFDLARRLSLAGDFYSSLIIMNILKKHISFQPTRANYELLYPRGFKEAIEQVCGERGIAPYLFFALVREESYFNPEIESHAGAVGLSQLMPATAKETAQRMNLDGFEITDPNDNLSIGSFYLAAQIDRFSVVTNALFAYNGGPGNMNSWRREFSDLPQDLLLEALPFAETRKYGRKVLVSAVAYGYLYYGIQPADIIAMFF